MGLRDALKKKVGEAVRGLSGRSADPDSSGRASESSRSGAMPSAPDAEGFRAVAPVSAVPNGRAGTYQAGPYVVAVFRVQGALYAIDSACVHEDGPLGEGSIAGEVVTCPYHDWRFDVRTGACLTEPTRSVACYAVKESGGFIWVGKKTRDGSRDRGGEHDDGLKVS